MTVLVTLEAVVIVLLAVLVAGLLRSHAEILRALHDLGAGIDPDAATASSNVSFDPSTSGRTEETPVYDVAGTTPSGEAISVGVAGADHSTLLAFLSSGCLTCSGFWEAFSDPAHLQVPGGARHVILTKGLDQESESRVRQLAPAEVPVVMSTAAWQDYGVPVAPYFIYVHGPSARIIGEGAAGAWPQISDLLGQALADAGLAQQRRSATRVRRQAPNVDTGSRVDAHLASAGITPGHPSLYPDPPDPEGRPER